MTGFSLPLSPKGYYRLAVGTFFFLQGLVFASWASRIPDIKAHLGLNEAELGSALFAMPLGQLVSMGVSGWLVSRLGSRNTLTAAAFLYPGALILVGLAQSLPHIFIALMLFGVAGNLHNISVNTQAVGVEKLYGHSIMAAFHGLWSFAGFTGGLIGAGLAGFGVAPLPHFGLIFLASLCILLVMRRSTLPRDVTAASAKPGSSRPGSAQNSPPAPRRLMFNRYIVLLGFIAFGNMACEGAMFDWSSVYFDVVLKSPEHQMRLGYIAFMSAMVCGRFMADRFVTRNGVVNVLRVSGLLIAAGLLLSILAPHVVTASLGFILVGFGTAPVVPICYSMAGRSADIHPGVALASVSTIGFFGFLLCPPVVGFIAQASSLRWSFALLVLLGLLTAALGSRLRPRSRQ